MAAIVESLNTTNGRKVESIRNGCGCFVDDCGKVVVTTDNSNTIVILDLARKPLPHLVGDESEQEKVILQKPDSFVVVDDGTGRIFEIRHIYGR